MENQMRTCEATKLINRWLVARRQHPIERKQGYVTFVRDIVQRLNLAEQNITTKREAEKFIQQVAEILSRGEAQNNHSEAA